METPHNFAVECFIVFKSNGPNLTFPFLFRNKPTLPRIFIFHKEHSIFFLELISVAVFTSKINESIFPLTKNMFCDYRKLTMLLKIDTLWKSLGNIYNPPAIDVNLLFHSTKLNLISFFSSFSSVFFFSSSSSPPFPQPNFFLLFLSFMNKSFCLQFHLNQIFQNLSHFKILQRLIIMILAFAWNGFSLLIESFI